MITTDKAKEIKLKIKPPILKTVEPAVKLRKRPDQELAGLEKTYFRYTVIKIKLAQFANKEVLPLLDKAVNDVNLITLGAYHLINLHFIRLIENDQPIPKKITQNMLYQSCCAVSKLNDKWIPVKDSVFNESVDMYRKTLPDGCYIPNRNKLCNLINNLNVTMLVAVNNHLNLNFRKRFHKYLWFTHTESDQAKIHYWIDCIFSLRKDAGPSKFDNNAESEALISDYKAMFGQPATLDISNNLDIYLPFYLKILRLLESNEKKLFSLLPIKRSLIPDHVKICTTALGDLVSLWTGEKVSHDKKHWETYFFPIRFETVNRRFDYQITTNGYDVSIVLKRKVQNKELPYTDDLPILDKIAKLRSLNKEVKQIKEDCGYELITENNWENCFGLDPGKRNLFTAVNDSGAVRKCTGREYYHLIGQKSMGKKMNKRVLNNNHYHEISFKTSSTKGYLTSLKALWAGLKEMIHFYKAKFFRKLRFTKYIKKQKTYNLLVTRLTDNKKTLIGYGDGGKNGTGIKGASVPIKGFRAILERDNRVDIVDIHEAYTSKMCSTCHAENGKIRYLKTVIKSDGSSQNVLVSAYGVLRCTNNECGISWDRDINAGRNILALLKCKKDGQERPSYLCKKKTKKGNLKCDSLS